MYEENWARFDGPGQPGQQVLRFSLHLAYPNRIGTEHEKLGFNLKDNSRLNYDQIAQLLRKLEARFGWQPIMEDGRIIGVQMDGQSVTLEPGGQFELSGAPVETIHKTCAEVNCHLYQVRAVARQGAVGVRVTGGANLQHPHAAALLLHTL